MADSVLLLYSSSTSQPAIQWLKDHLDAYVITLTLDLGQGGDLVGLRDSALAAGAVRAHVIDSREEFARHYVLPSLQAGARRAGVVPLPRQLGTAVLARRLVDVAQMERARAVAYAGSSGGQVDLLATSIRSLDPRLAIVRPPVTTVGMNARAWPRIQTNLWGRSIMYDRPGSPVEAFALTRFAMDCPNEPAVVEIQFDRGVPVRANGIDMPLIELIESLEIIAGAHGVGRIDVTDIDRDEVGRSQVCEAPAAVVLHDAHQAIEAFVIPDELRHLKRQVAEIYVGLLEAGRWVAPARDALDAFVGSVQQRVNGTVRIELFKAHCRCLGVRAAASDDLSNSSSQAEPQRAAALGREGGSR